MHKLGIIVPYRNRYEHLAKFHDHLKIYLDKKDINYTLIIVEQDNASAFNRGMLCNIGFKEAVKQKCDYVVFHDVDMLPIDVDYSYSSHPVHLATDNLPFESYFGGMTLFPVEDFKKIDGFSNKYWGWGFEDDDLRYRCIKNNIKLKEVKEKINGNGHNTAIFNGVNSYIKIKNKLNVLRDFKLQFTIRLDKLVLDHTKQLDDYVIFNLKGNDFILKYTSFKRFSLQVFDSNNKLYEIYSEIVDFKNYNIEIEYNARQKEVSLYLNDNLVGSKKLDTKIYNYNRVNNIFLGATTDLSSYFRGAIDRFTIINNRNEYIGEYNSENIEEYQFIDSADDNHGELVNIEVNPFKPTTIPNSFIPFRRNSKIEKLNHEENGFQDGRWKSDLTRWNQLRFTNEVMIGVHDNSNDGLSTCEFTLHGRLKNNNVIHLNIGI